MRRGRCLLTVLLSACSGDPARDHGPAPGADHQSTVRAAMDRVLGARHELDGSPAYRFAAPKQDRVARWLFEPEVEGRSHEFGYVYGWSVEFWVTPRYVGYTEQPQSHKMAFFVDGRLAGLFAEGTRNAPLELDRWAPDWVDMDGAPAGAGRALRASVR